MTDRVVRVLGVVVVAATLQAQARTTKDAIFTEAQARRGEMLYGQQCAMCHGPTLAGIEMASPLTGPEFDASWVGAPVNDLFERIRLSMPQDKPGSLSRQQTADLVAFILKFNKAPAGPRELPGEAEVLKSIQIAGQ